MSVFVIFLRETTMDDQALDTYSASAGPSAKGHAITPLAFYGDIETLEGEPFEGCVILRFPTLAEAHGWYDSPAYQAAREHRLKGAHYRVFITQGVSA